MLFSSSDPGVAEVVTSALRITELYTTELMMISFWVTPAAEAIPETIVPNWSLKKLY